MVSDKKNMRNKKSGTDFGRRKAMRIIGVTSATGMFWDGEQPTPNHPIPGVATHPHYDPQRKSLGDVQLFAKTQPGLAFPVYCFKVSMYLGSSSPGYVNLVRFAGCTAIFVHFQLSSKRKIKRFSPTKTS